MRRSSAMATGCRFKGYQHTLDLLRARAAAHGDLVRQRPDGHRRHEAAVERGLNVPDDLSIMGYDDQELARYTHPPFTTLVLPNYEMGRRAPRR